MRQGPPSGRRGPRRPHSGSGGGHTNTGGNGGGGGGYATHQAPRGEAPRRSAASLRNQSFDSNGPEVRVRGNAWQVHEKYQALARDAQMAGDRVAAENLLQHAEHYYRIIEAINDATAAEQPAARGGYQQQAPGNTQPDARGLYPAVPATGQSGEHASGQPMPQPEVNMAPPGFAPQPALQPMATTHPTTAPVSPFFTPEEAEAEAETQPARVASF
jgi:hypothetical protein